ncbi:hypothetical protein AGRHK599_LOCUS4939 [Rhizobium rhizogenes]|uniref:Uncharacterized protein n=1 Tax=Rhizobium rhizogenes TaxID=359 RepID=A0AAN2A8I3_RHIRH|nr:MULTISPECIES: hypothetical protein [Rhizobium/Agrobacterium group]MBO0129040.1 hypothetical protein [Agrobacterium sp. OT33]MCZ7445864.1 hypothetical protein [Rhizobium rhizogenes]NSZ81949.1 hypothetical protein [Agrobacterium tumefaciens]CAD0216676.1 hypothetical protein AGRHK599_LOCUS4939 [Rhizobium rhizogenes]
MKTTLTIVSFVLFSGTSAVMAFEPLPEGTSKLNAIVRGHGELGDTVISTSNPDVSFRLLENGVVERTNSRYNTVTYSRPEEEARRFRNRR